MQLWSQIGRKVAIFVYKMTLKKSSKNKKNQKAEKILRNKSETNIIDLLSHFLPNQRPHFQNSSS